MKNPPNKRSRFLINPGFQLSVIRQMLALTGVVIAIFYGAIYYHFWSLEQQGLSLGLPATHVFFDFLAEQRRTMDLIFLVTSMAALLAIVGFGLFLSHRVAGPLFRLKQYLDSQGPDVPAHTPLKFREGDYFPEVADSVNSRLGTKRDA